MTGELLEFTDATFDTDVLQSPQPVVVDFYAPWCGPCKLLAPVVEELASDYAGRVRVGKLDTDRNDRVSMDYRIETIPTVMIFKGGQVVDVVRGLVRKQELVAAVERHLA